jgi:hypothetical protein
MGGFVWSLILESGELQEYIIIIIQDSQKEAKSSDQKIQRLSCHQY